MTAFFEGLIRFFGLFLDIAFWIGLFLIGLFVAFVITCYVGASLIMSMIG